MCVDLVVAIAYIPHFQRNGGVDLCEFFQALPRKQHDPVWVAVLSLAQGIVLRLQDTDRTKDDEKNKVCL